jgi:hypothetical protein
MIYPELVVELVETKPRFFGAVEGREFTQDV